MKEFYFIRHGQTDCNKLDDGKCYMEDAPLNKKGKSQAKKTGLYLKKYRMTDKPFDCILSSPRIRAFQTANIIADQIDYVNPMGLSEVTKVKELKELSKGFIRDYLDYQQEILGEINDPIEYWEALNKIDTLIEERYKPKNFEKNIDEGIDIFIESLKNMKEDKIIIVSHYGFLFKALIPRMFNMPAEAIQHYTEDQDNCAICYIRFYESKDLEGSKTKFEMVMPPSTEHLKLKL